MSEPEFSMKGKLARLEAQLQTLIEGSAARIFPLNLKPAELAAELIVSMQAGTKTRSDGQAIAPNRFLLLVHPSQAETLSQSSDLLDQLSQTLHQSGEEAGLLFLSPPTIRISIDGSVPPQQIQVQAEIRMERLDQTTDLDVETSGPVPPIPANAFLIVNGTEMFNLDQSVINVGRRPDNDLVIEDPRISRVHAQLRAVRGRYVIFDLDSTGGTFVNEQRIAQSMLFAGDVISLAGVPLVFGQETGRLGQTQRLSPSDEIFPGENSSSITEEDHFSDGR